MKLHVGTCQFPVSGDVRRNTQYVLRQMRTAKARGAQVVHFPECALSGYAGPDLPSYDGFDWTLLREGAERVLELAGELGIWVILGSAHPLSGGHKPHNSVYVIDDRGELVDRYDKRFCAGDAGGQTGELLHYTPGNHPTVFTIDGVRCGALICHEYRYPELYREYERLGVELIFHAFHAGNASPERLQEMEDEVGRELHSINKGSTLPEITMPAAMHSAAADNHVWISASNSSARHSCWPAFLVRPDGVITGRLRRNQAGVLVSTVDTEGGYYDSTAAWRGRAISGILHSGELVEDPRSDERTSL